MSNNIQGNINELRFDSIMPDLKVTSQKQVFQNLAAHVEKLIGTPQSKLTIELDKAEQSQSSAIGNGVAILHAKLPRLTKPFVVFTRAINPIDFDAADNLPVDLICMVLSPTHDDPVHLRHLATVSRFFSNQNFCESLRHAEDSDNIKSVINDMNKQRLAA